MIIWGKYNTKPDPMNNFSDKDFGILQKHLQGEERQISDKDHDILRDF